MGLSISIAAMSEVMDVRRDRTKRLRLVGKDSAEQNHLTNSLEIMQLA